MAGVSNKSPPPKTSSPKSAVQAKGKVAAVKSTKGANPALLKVAKSINIAQYKKDKNGTHCNAAFNAISKKLGYSFPKGVIVANQMVKHMEAGKDGWKKVSKDEAIQAAKAGKHVAAGWYNDTPAPASAKRPDNRKPGHIATVIGEYSPGVPGIAQAGSENRTSAWMKGGAVIGGVSASYYVRN
jgi:hypothetical protein